MTALIFTSPDLPPDQAPARTKCFHCGQPVALTAAGGVLRVAAHDLPAFGGLAGACPGGGRGMGRVGRGASPVPRPDDHDEPDTHL